MYQDVSGKEFIKQLKAADNWAMVEEPGTYRFIMVVQNEGEPDRQYRSPSPENMSDVGFRIFMEELNQVADEKGIPDAI